MPLSIPELIQNLHYLRLIRVEKKQYFQQALENLPNSQVILDEFEKVLTSTKLSKIGNFEQIFSAMIDQDKKEEQIIELSASLAKLAEIFMNESAVKPNFREKLINFILHVKNPMQKVQMYVDLVRLRSVLLQPKELKKYKTESKSFCLARLKDNAVLLFEDDDDFKHNSLALIQTNQPKGMLTALVELAQNHLSSEVTTSSLIDAEYPDSMVKAMIKYKNVWQNEDEKEILSRLSKSQNYGGGLQALVECRDCSDIPSKYKSLKYYYSVLLHLKNPTFIFKDIIRLHQTLKDLILEDDVMAICKALLKRTKILSHHHLEALAEIYKEDLFVNPAMRFQVIYSVFKGENSKGIFKGLKHLKQKDLLNQEQTHLWKLVLIAHCPESMAKSLSKLLGEPDLTKKLESLFDGFALARLNYFEFTELYKILSKADFLGDEQLKNMTYDTSKSMFLTPELLARIFMLLREHPRLKFKIGRQYFYLSLAQLERENTAIVQGLINLERLGVLSHENIDRFFNRLKITLGKYIYQMVEHLYKIGFLNSQTESTNFDLFFQLLYRCDDNDYKYLLNFIEITVQHAPEKVEGVLNDLIRRDDYISVLRMFSLYKDILPLGFKYYFDLIIKNQYNIRDNSVEIKGMLLNSLLDCGIWNKQNEQIILDSTFEEIIWRYNLPSFKKFSFHNQEIFNVFMNKDRLTTDEKLNFARLIFMFTSEIQAHDLIQNNISLLVAHVDVLANNRVFRLIYGYLPRHLFTNDFLNQIGERCLETQALAPEVRVLSIVNFLQAFLQPLPAQPLQPQRRPVYVTHNWDQKMNHAQNVHNNFVEKSAFESAKRLKERYTETPSFENIKKSLIHYLDSYPQDEFKDKKIRACLKNFTDTYFYFNETSGMNMLKLLQCCWQAIHDQSRLFPGVSINDAIESLLLNGLYTMQRSYNIDENGQDNLKAKDDITCQKGGFIFLVASLNTIHQDVNIKFITAEGAGLYLESEVKLAVENYLSTQRLRLVQHEFDSLIFRMKEEGVEPIWSSISKEIIEKMFEEYGALFHNDIYDHQFRAFMSTYQDVDIGHILKRFESAPLSSASAAAISEENSEENPFSFFSQRFPHDAELIGAKRKYNQFENSASEEEEQDVEQEEQDEEFNYPASSLSKNSFS